LKSIPEYGDRGIGHRLNSYSLTDDRHSVAGSRVGYSMIGKWGSKRVKLFKHEKVESLAEKPHLKLPQQQKAQVRCLYWPQQSFHICFSQ
jgi:hypothetical protein